MDCLFCKIAMNEIPADILYEDDNLLAFRDIHPQAPVHILIIPKKHISRLNDLEAEDAHLMGLLTLAAKNLAIKNGIDQSGYRILMNCNDHAGQTVFHLHMHLLGGKPLPHLG
ncbi:MAG: histidine triad nucleotide-binding protein [Gammaproteobacteria bacterium]|nr:histidine triad nucleotide-binding protein [Gammaproteobacteria bacterium]